MISKIVQRLGDSYNMFTFGVKKQLLANAIKKADAVGGLSEVLPVPTDAASGENFIERIKQLREDSTFANENNCLSKALIGAAPKLVLYVKKSVMPSVQTRTLAGAFNRDELDLGVEVKVVDDFGDASANVYAMLVDPRGIKLHRDYHAIRTQELASSDAVNFVDHSEHTGWISKYTYIHVFKKA